MPEPAEPTLRDRLAEALRQAPVRGTAMRMTVLTELYGPVDALVDAALAVVQHDLESLEQQAGNARAVARAANQRAEEAEAALEKWDELRAEVHEQMRAGFAEMIRSKWNSEMSEPDADMAADACIDYLENDFAGQLARAQSERDRAMAGVPLVCSDDRHQAKVRGLEAELAAAEETAAEQQQNALHWQERAEALAAAVLAVSNELTQDGRHDTAERLSDALDKHEQDGAPNPARADLTRLRAVLAAHAALIPTGLAEALREAAQP